MNWTIKIEGKTNQRIVVIFDPIKTKLLFHGEYKPRNSQWVVFETFDSNDLTTVLDSDMNFDTEKVLRIIERILRTLDKKSELYETLYEGFKPMKENSIELQEED